MRFVHVVGAGVAALALGLVSACSGPLGESTGISGAAADRDVAAGDVSPRKVVEAGVGPAAMVTDEDDADEGDAAPERVIELDPADEAEDEADEVADVVVRLPPLEQPDSPFPTPAMPDPPAEDADEYHKVIYDQKQWAWMAAGVVDADAESSCEGFTRDLLISVGVYDGTCDLEVSGLTVHYAVDIEITERQVIVRNTTEYLPVSERKAVYEATRQSFQPARVTCSLVGIELVRVGQSDGFTCWVTDTGNEVTTYHGTLQRDGELLVIPADSGAALDDEADGEGDGEGDSATDDESGDGESGESGDDG